MKISTAFDSGKIEVLSLDDPGNIQLRIPEDTHSYHFQWLHFKLIDAKDQLCNMTIVNAHEASFSGAWKDCRICVSYDQKNWFRIDTEYDGKQLLISHTPEQNVVYYALFEPYPLQRHQYLLGEAQLSPYCHHTVIGESVQGRDIDLLVIGNPDSPLTFWTIARQHPGETMAEWCMEGFLNRLLDGDDEHAQKLLESVCFYVVPNMNPDGCYLGNLRCNAAGANLNREWQQTTLEKSPEVLCVQQKMQQTGVDFFLDMHGDEEIPHVFLIGTEGVPSYNDNIQQLEAMFKKQLFKSSADFQDEHGYPKAEPGQANLALATNYIGETFKCLAFTLELPFLDNAAAPDQKHGWNGKRSRRFGKALVDPMLKTMQALQG